MKYILYIVGGILGLILILCILYFILLMRLRKINVKLYKRVEEENLKDKRNVLIVYQPSRHKTTSKIKDKIKEFLIEKGYGYKITTLCSVEEDYTKYVNTIFIMPVYFGEVHAEFLNKVRSRKIKNLLIVYNGLNDGNSEDKLVNKLSLAKYSKIKLHTKNIDDVVEFLIKEGL